MKFRIITYVCIIQLTVIISIIFKIYTQKSAKVISVAEIPTGTLQFSYSGELMHFYEPIAGVHPDPNMNFKIFNSINKDTFNERFDYKYQKDINTYRIVTLGDSFTYGLHVPTSSNWTEILEISLNDKMKCKSEQKFEVINLGVSGYDRRYAVERYIGRGVKYEPDLILWLDLSPFRDAETIHRKLELLPKSIPSTKKYNDYFLKEQTDTIRNTSIVLLEKSLVESTRILDNYYKGKILLLSFPFTTKSERNALKKIVNLRKDTYYFENLPDIYKEELAFKNDGHPNEKGHRMISKDIYQYLKDSRLIPCKG